MIQLDVMNKLFYILLFIPVFCFGQPLSHNQYMITYDGAYNNDTVGVFDCWYPTQDTASTTFFYSLIDDEGGIYGINDSVIYILSNTSLTSGIDTLIVRTILGGNTQDNYVYVTVKAESDCYFIDPDAGAGSGTRASPYNSWASVTFVAGKAYFQKRGTQWNSLIYIGVDGTLDNEIIIGAYGVGNRPEFSDNTGDAIIDIQASYIQFYELYVENNYYGINTYGDDTYTNIRISDCEFNNTATQDGAIYLSNRRESGNLTVDQYMWYHEIYDVVSHDHTNGYGMKIEGSAVYVRNFRGYNNLQGISLPMVATRDTIVGFSGWNNSTKGIEISGWYHDISYSIIDATSVGDGIVADDTSCTGTIIHNCYLTGGTYWGVIGIHGSGGGPPYYGGNFIIEDNVIRNSSSGNGIWIGYNMDNIIIRRNIIYGNSNGIRYGASANGIDSLFVYYNIFYDNTDDIEIVGGDTIYIYNNTIDGNITISGASADTVRNCYFSSLTGATYSSNNIDIDTITTANHFIDYVGNDYHLKKTAISAIDNGYNYGQAKDFDNVGIEDSPDIGAFEFEKKRRYLYWKGTKKKIFYKGTEKKIYWTK